jgi:hypothetical protein
MTFASPPIAEDATVTTIPVQYSTGKKDVEFKVENGILVTRRIGATDNQFKQPTIAQLDAFVKYQAEQYNKKCK